MCVPLKSFCVLSHEVWWALKSTAIIRLRVSVRVERSNKRSLGQVRDTGGMYMIIMLSSFFFILNFIDCILVCWSLICVVSYYVVFVNWMFLWTNVMRPCSDGCVSRRSVV